MKYLGLVQSYRFKTLKIRNIIDVFRNRRNINIKNYLFTLIKFIDNIFDINLFFLLKNKNIKNRMN
jgi:hypothetical protein